MLFDPKNELRFDIVCQLLTVVLGWSVTQHRAIFANNKNTVYIETFLHKHRNIVLRGEIKYVIMIIPQREVI